LLMAVILSNVRAQTVTEITNILNTKPQTVTTAAVSANTTNLFSLDMQTYGYRAITITITGTWVATVSFQGSNDNFTTVDAIPTYDATSAGAVAQTTTTANGTFRFSTIGWRYIRVRTTAYTSGTINSNCYAYLNNLADGNNSSTINGTISVSGVATSTKQSDGTQKTQVVDGSGNVIGSTSNAIDINIKSGNPTSITANAGTNLNTSLLALEAGGNLATIAGKDFATQTTLAALNTKIPTLTLVGSALKVDNSAVTQPVSGTFWQATQPVSGTVTATIAAGATAIGKAEDVASADADVGAGMLAVRKATPANTSGTDGDYEFLQMNAGRLWTSATIDAALPAGTNAIGKLAANSGVTIGAIEIAAAQTLATVSTVTNLSQLGGTAIAMNTGVRSAGTQRVTIATDDVVPASQSGTWNIGTVTTLTGITNVVHVDDNSSSLSIDIGGTAPTLGATANVASISGILATSPVAVYNATPVTLTDTRFSNLQLDVNGYLKTNVTNTITVGSHAVTNAGTFVVQENGSALTALQLIDNIPNTLGSTTSGQSGVLGLGAVTTAAPSYTTAQTNALSLQTDGSLRVAVTAMPSTTVTATNLSTNVAQMNGVAVTMGNGTSGTGVQRVVIASDNTANSNPWLVSGAAASGATVSGNPLNIGTKAVNAEQTAVTNGQEVNLVADLVGKLIVSPYSNPENMVSGAITTAMTGTTSTSLVAAPGASLRNYITTIIVSNAHATVGTDIIIQDGSGGTTLMTIPAGAVYGGAVINLPVPLRQPTTNTAIFCANVTTGASTKVSAVGYKGL